jgi:hypothetical protein
MIVPEMLLRIFRAGKIDKFPSEAWLKPGSGSDAQRAAFSDPGGQGLSSELQTLNLN